MSKPFAAVLTGSESDLPVVEKTLEVLEALEGPCEVKITAAHGTPDATPAYVTDAEARGCQVFLAAAGLGAPMAGAVAGPAPTPVRAALLAFPALGEAGRGRTAPPLFTRWRYGVTRRKKPFAASAAEDCWKNAKKSLPLAASPR